MQGHIWPYGWWNSKIGGMDLGWDESVSMRLASLALDKGRLTDDLVTSLAIRGALLVDLTLRGRLTETEASFQFDPSPSGLKPADDLLADGARSALEMLQRGPVDQFDLAAEHLRRGSWSLKRRGFRRRYIDHRADRTRQDKQSLKFRRTSSWTPTEASLVAIAGVLEPLPTGHTLPSDELLAATGPARRLVELTVQEVDQRMSRGRAVRWTFT